MKELALKMWDNGAWIIVVLGLTIIIKSAYEIRTAIRLKKFHKRFSEPHGLKAQSIRIARASADNFQIIIDTWRDGNTGGGYYYECSKANIENLIRQGLASLNPVGYELPDNSNAVEDPRNANRS